MHSLDLILTEVYFFTECSSLIQSVPAVSAIPQMSPNSTLTVVWHFFFSFPPVFFPSNSNSFLAPTLRLRAFSGQWNQQQTPNCVTIVSLRVFPHSFPCSSFVSTKPAIHFPKKRGRTVRKTHAYRPLRQKQILFGHGADSNDAITVFVTRCS